MRLPVAIFLIVTAGFFLVIWSMPHYAAPLTCVIVLLLVQAIRHLRTMRALGRRGWRGTGTRGDCAACH